MTSDPVVAEDDGALVRPRVSPNARETELQGPHGGATLKLKVAAPPADGEANAETERFLASLAGVARSDVRVMRGLSARDKTVFVGGVGAERLREVLSSRGR